MDETSEGRQGGDLVLAQGEMALVKDGANGNVDVIVGPYLHSLAKSDEAVQFNAETGRFEGCSSRGAVQPCPVAKEGQYIILENPVRTDEGKHPEKGKIKAQDLDTGRRINISGPATFALFPGQSTSIIDGHILRTNQYLIARVINGEAAMENWAEAVLKPQTSVEEPEKTPKQKPKIAEVPYLVTGQLLIIKGTEVSFYIPPTGIEVIAEKSGYVRDAVTLEQLEYCILLDEEGTKEYVRGPAVVFPKPTQSFYIAHEIRKFSAIELNDLMGVYIKVIKPYEGESGASDKKPHKEGDELFITGADQKIYWPRVEHSIIRYGKRDLHYAVAVPKGEARYVLDRSKGGVNLEKGPNMFLPDPRKEVIVRRGLSPNLIKLLYPGNAEAVEYNRTLSQRDEEGGFGMEEEMSTSGAMYASIVAGDEFERKAAFTPPRTIQLDTKYDGAVRVMVWTGYAMKVVSMTGQSRIVVGPETTFLEYDEVPELLELSTGTPKSDDASIKVVYLRVKANKVSDVIQAETLDYVQVQIPVSYRVNFEGAQEKWFDVENYVKFLTDHLRSLVANTTKRHGIEKFNSNYIDILRDSILGISTEKEKRPGRVFEENGMHIYDVELGKLKIGDAEIEGMLQDSQYKSVEQTLSLTNDRRKLEVEKETQKIQQDINAAKAETRLEEMGIQEVEAEKGAVFEDIKLKAELEEEKLRTEIHTQEMNRTEAELSQERDQQKALVAIDTEAVIKKAGAITPDMVEAIQVFADKDLAGKLATSMSPLAMLSRTSLAEVFISLVKGTSIGKRAEKILEGRIRKGKEGEDGK